MDAFRFSPELFELRGNVMEALEQAGFQWLTDYSSVDCMHDLYGIEVCGIRQEQDSLAICRLLAKMFPGWICRRGYKDYGREPGWRSKIHRDKRRPRENWDIA